MSTLVLACLICLCEVATNVAVIWFPEATLFPVGGCIGMTVGLFVLVANLIGPIRSDSERHQGAGGSDAG